MAHQQSISAARLQKRIGQKTQVLIDEVNDDGAIGRSYSDAPEIDGCVYVSTDRRLKPGELVDVEIMDADEYDLYADTL